MIGENNTNQTLSHWHNMKLKVVGEGALVGALVGLVVVAYRFALDFVSNLLLTMINYTQNNVFRMFVFAIVVLFIAFIIKKIVIMNPMVGSSGIPEVKGFLVRKVGMSWFGILVHKFIGGVLSASIGLSLGREGPSVQLGAAVGKGFATVSKRKKLEEKYLVTQGASAGLAAAFNAPLAGVLFSLEVFHKNFSSVVVISALVSAAAADFVSKIFFGLKPTFALHVVNPLSLKYYPFILLLGIIMGVFGVLFNRILLSFKKYYKIKTLIPIKYKFFVPAGLAIIFAYILPEVLGGGHGLVDEMAEGHFAFRFLVILLVIKFLFTLICYASGAPGGIFVPLLAIGAITGNLYGQILHKQLGMDQSIIILMMILAMAGYLASVVRTPLTGCILVCEAVGSFEPVLAVAFVTAVAYLVAAIMKSEPIYDLLFNLEINKKNDFRSDDHTKVVIEAAVWLGSHIEGKKIKEIKWPEECLLVGIKRGEIEQIPSGDTQILVGDLIIALTDEDKATRIREELEKMVESEDPELSTTDV